jgi:hypothetical protein
VGLNKEEYDMKNIFIILSLIIGYSNSSFANSKYPIGMTLTYKTIVNGQAGTVITKVTGYSKATQEYKTEVTEIGPNGSNVEYLTTPAIECESIKKILKNCLSSGEGSHLETVPTPFGAVETCTGEVPNPEGGMVTLWVGKVPFGFVKIIRTRGSDVVEQELTKHSVKDWVCN